MSCTLRLYVIAIWSLWLSSLSWKKKSFTPSCDSAATVSILRSLGIKSFVLITYRPHVYIYIHQHILYIYNWIYIWVCVYIYIYCTPRKQQLKSLKKIIKCKFLKHKQIYTYTLLYKTIYTLNEEWQYHHGLVFNVHHVNYHVNDLKMIFCKCRSEI